MHHSKDRGGYMGALIINRRTSISLGATAGDDDQVREIVKVGIQVSKNLFHRGGLIEMILDTPCYPILSMRRWYKVSTSQDRFRHEEGQ